MGVRLRDQVKMTPEQERAFLEECAGAHSVSMATFNRDGSIHLVGMYYGFLEGSVAFLAKAKSQKVLNLRRNPRVSCLIESGPSYGEIRGVSLVGRVEIVENSDRVRALAVDFIGRAFRERFRPSVEASVYKRVALKVLVDRSVSWDHGKIELPPGVSASV
jgi:nitroimidazol reductase NimA-like FMN-containing flavoprotein (pyridoxamine 5'-phosphate oxidase superfamily)